MGDWHRTEAEAKGLGKRLQDKGPEDTAPSDDPYYYYRKYGRASWEQPPRIVVEIPAPVKIKCGVDGLPTGWVCPRCCLIYSPHVTQCPQCVPTTTGTGDNA